MANKKLPSAETGPSDAILPMHERFMDEIVAGGKNYEFRHYRIKRSVKRIWLYCTAPSSSIKYICEIDPARTRNPGDPPLEEDGRGNREFKNRAKGWEKDDYAYKVRFIYQVQPPVTLADMETKYGMKAAPPSVVSVPESMRSVVVWDLQKKSMLVKSDLQRKNRD